MSQVFLMQSRSYGKSWRLGQVARYLRGLETGNRTDIIAVRSQAESDRILKAVLDAMDDARMDEITEVRRQRAAERGNYINFLGVERPLSSCPHAVTYVLDGQEICSNPDCGHVLTEYERHLD